jgi:hypothetical protein
VKLLVNYKQNPRRDPFWLEVVWQRQGLICVQDENRSFTITKAPDGRMCENFIGSRRELVEKGRCA